MAVPKKKITRSRRDMRRYASGNALKKPTIGMCPSCNEPVRPHRLCSKGTDCGQYQAKHAN